MSTVVSLLDRRSCSNRLAIICGADGEGVTWWEVADQARRWSLLGVTGPVGLALEDPVAMAANFVAALAAGVTVAPLDPSAPPADVAARVAQLGLRALVVSPGRTPLPDIETFHAGRRSLRSVGGCRRPAAAFPPVPAQVAALMASSGTTGTPKIIPLTESSLVETAAGVARELQLEPGQRGYSPLPLFHINGLVVGVLSALVSGATIVVDRRFSRRRFWATVARTQATWLNLVPAILSLIDPPPADLTGVRLARSASAPLPAGVRRRFEAAAGIPVVETYGMTEAASQITANPLADIRAGSVGRPVDLDLRVVDGRVQIRGSRVTPVYWSFDGGEWSSRSALSPDGWLETGDLGRLDEDGYLYLVGREGDVINRAGEKIAPREVEDLLLADRRVAAAVVVGRPHPVTGEEPVAFVLPAPGPISQVEALAADLMRRCEESLSKFKCPAQVIVAESLPAGPTGKVRRSEVKAMAAAGGPLS